MMPSMPVLGGASAALPWLGDEGKETAHIMTRHWRYRGLREQVEQLFDALRQWVWTIMGLTAHFS
jgi:hypothetical protein